MVIVELLGQVPGKVQPQPCNNSDSYIVPAVQCESIQTCVCVQDVGFEPMLKMPAGMQNESDDFSRLDCKQRPAGQQLKFAHSTLQGHALAGEERFAVEWHEDDDSVW